MDDVHISLNSLRHGWGLAAVWVVLTGVCVTLGLVFLTDRQYLAAASSFFGVAFLALMVKVVVTAQGGGNSHS